MSQSDFSYQAEKFNAARRILMAPHRKGESVDFVVALHECYRALQPLDRDQIQDDNVNGWLRMIDEAMDISDVIDPQGRGKLKAKALNFTDDERDEISSAVDEALST